MKETRKSELWDVAVIGGGASGMMAAGYAAANGARVVLIEKNPSLGKKLLITGGGRCNITNAEPDQRVFLSKFNSRTVTADQFLFSPFSRHRVSDSLSFFNDRGLETKVEARNRVFPVTDSAQSVWDVLRDFLTQGKVQIQSGVPVVSVVSEKGVLSHIVLKNDQRIYAKNFIFATGGLSHPETGSTGDGFEWLRVLGHTVSNPDPSLVPLTVKDSWVLELAGLTLPDITLTLTENGKRIAKQRGGLVFTHKGISGPAALNISRDVGERLPYGPVTLSLDLLPRVSNEAVDVLLRDAISAESNRKIQNVLGSIIPSTLVPQILEQTDILGEIPAHSILREQRIALGAAIKNMPISIKGRLGFDKAIIASGGVALTEIDTRTMQSRIVRNLYIIGDLLNIDRPSGGYSLQLCWTTGAVAGQSAARTDTVSKTI